MRALTILSAILLASACRAGEELILNGDFAGEWRPNTSSYDTGVAEGDLPEQWEDVSTWSGASTRYSRLEEDGKSFLRLELTDADDPKSVLQFRSGFPIAMRAGETYRVSARMRSDTGATVSIEVRQHQEPRIRFWETRIRLTPEWQDLSHIAQPTETGDARFFLALRELGTVDVASISIQHLDESERPAPEPPAPLTGARCVSTRGDLIRHSDIIAMYQEGDPEVLRKYLIDVVAWGGQLAAKPDRIAERKALIQAATDAGVRIHAVDCAMAQEGGRFVVSQGDRSSPNQGLFWELRKDNEGTIRKLGEAGVDLTADTVLNVEGDWIGVPWLRKRWRIPMASVHSPAARKWFREHMLAIAEAGATAIHFDEPAMGSYGLQHPTPGDFSHHAMTAFREWLKARPEEVWRDAGIESLDGFDYRAFVLADGGNPKAAPLWREFVRFQLFTTRDHVRGLRDIVRERVGRDIPLSMNANASSWIKLPFLELQDFMTTEVRHDAKNLRVPSAPVLVYRLADAFGQPVASTAMGHDWYEMKRDQRPVLVSSWLAMGYALGHHLMMPCKAWIMDPVLGSQTYRPVSDEYACMARFIKSVGHLLDGYEPVSVVSVAISCDAIEREATALNALVSQLANHSIPFSMAVEGNDLLERHVDAAAVSDTSAILVGSPHLLDSAALDRIRELSGARPVVEHYGGALPASVPRPITVSGAEGVWVLPRARPGDAEAPCVLHVLNRDYDADARAMSPKGPFMVTVDAKLFSGRALTRGTMYQPMLRAKLPADADAAFAAETELAISTVDGATVITVPSLDIWGVIELR